MARRRITYEELAARYEAWRAKTAAYRAAYYARPEVKAKRVAYWANLRRLATLAKEAGLG